MARATMRVLTCGSVDDGKSTLIGRLLYDSGLILADQLEALRADSRDMSTAPGAIDPAFVTDGLADERQQGITIDVGYRYFATPRRAFIVADAPGHEQYTRNMASGASVCDVAIVVLDVTKGVRLQTRRHAAIVSLLGIKLIVLAVNKMDCIGWDRERFESVRRDFMTWTGALRFSSVVVVPVAALTGDNVVHRSQQMPWYDGPTLLDVLETADAPAPARHSSLRLPIQRVARANGVRGYQGTLLSGSLAVSDTVTVLPSGATSSIAAIHSLDGEVDCVQTNSAVTVMLADDIDVGRGDVLVAGEMPRVTNDVDATVVWLSRAPLDVGRRYWLKHQCSTVGVVVSRVRSVMDVGQRETRTADRLQLNDIGQCVLRADREIVCDAYEVNRRTGSFILIDAVTADTVGAGLIDAPASSVEPDATVAAPHVSLAERATRYGHNAQVVWLTGLSGAGKSTIAREVERLLFDAGLHCIVLDGDDVRRGLSADLGFSDADRRENIRRLGAVAALLAGSGLIVLVPVISPFREDRLAARRLAGDSQFLEVWVDTPLSICEARDVKGLYRRARSGELGSFTGISSDYEVPEQPDLRLTTTEQSPRETARVLARLIQSRTMRPTQDQR